MTTITAHIELYNGRRLVLGSVEGDKPEAEKLARRHARCNLVTIGDKAYTVEDGTGKLVRWTPVAGWNTLPAIDAPAPRPAAAPKAPRSPVVRTVARGPGVIDTVRAILEATKAPGITLAEATAKLHAAFPDRDPTALGRTFTTQVSRLPREKGVQVVREGGRYYTV